MNNNFFIPFKGENYGCGVGKKKKKILVIGASFYCPFINGDDNCKQCTDINHKDSSPYDRECKIYKSKGKVLHNEPTYSIEDEATAYKKFAASKANLLEPMTTKRFGLIYHSQIMSNSSYL